MPGRLGIAAMMGFAVLGGTAFAELAAWTRGGGQRRRVGAVARAALAVVVVVLLHRASLVPGGSPMGQPYPVFAAPHATEAILEAAQRIGGPILALPSNLDDVASQADAMYVSIAHWQPLLNGYSSFYPTGFSERMDTARRVPDPDALRTLVHETGLRLVWVRTAYPQPKRPAWMMLADRGGGPGLQLVARDDGNLLLAVVAVDGGDAH